MFSLGVVVVVALVGTRESVEAVVVLVRRLRRPSLLGLVLLDGEDLGILGGWSRDE